MAGVDLSTRDCGGQVVVALRGQLDMAAAAGAAAALAAVAAREREIIVDLAGLDFIDSSGVAALVRGRNLARQAGGELLLAAPRQQVLRVLTLTRLIEVFAVHATVAEAAGRPRRVPVLPPRPGPASRARAAMRSAARALAGERRQLRKRAGAAEAFPCPRTAEPFPSWTASGSPRPSAPGQAPVPVNEHEHRGPDRETGKNDHPKGHRLGQDAADHEGGEQGDRDRVGSHGRRHAGLRGLRVWRGIGRHDPSWEAARSGLARVYRRHMSPG
jgi:anti-sigma B factor antagonist